MADRKTATSSETRQDAADRRTQLVKDQLARENAATDAKTARLKALRLAQEAAAPPAPVKAKKPRKAKK